MESKRENKLDKYKGELKKTFPKAEGKANMFEHGKIPPQAIELEQLVLGAMMLESDAVNKTIDVLKPDMFYKDAHFKIFSAIHDLFNESEPIDIQTVVNKLKSEGVLDIVGGAYYVSSLTANVASSANIEYHARIIAQKYIQRELIRISSDIIREAFEDTTDVFNLLDRAESNLFEVAQNNLRKSAADMVSVIKEAIENIEDASKNEGNISGIPSGFHKLDHITAGWQPSDLIILAARPGMGKTAFVLSLAKNIALDFKHPIAVFSLEMSAVQLVTRLISAEAEIPSDKLRKGNLEDSEWTQLNKGVQALTDAKIFIDDTPGLSIFELRAKSRRLVMQHGIKMIIIDYLQLMTHENGSGNREQEISTISRSLKALAKELSVPIITLSQLNRSVEQRGGAKRPQLADLRESGAIEQDADMVCFLYRPAYYQLEEEYGEGDEKYTELIIAKHRNGALDTVKLNFINTFAKFEPRMDETSDFFNADTMPNEGFDEGPSIMKLQSKMNDDLDEDDNDPLSGNTAFDDDFTGF
jgi:replicative DNA helicase